MQAWRKFFFFVELKGLEERQKEVDEASDLPRKEMPVKTRLLLQTTKLGFARSAGSRL